MSGLKLAFHDADTDFLARMSARMSVSVSESWNASLTARRRTVKTPDKAECLTRCLSVNIPHKSNSSNKMIVPLANNMYDIPVILKIHPSFASLIVS